MEQTKPRDQHEYRKWLTEHLKVEIDDREVRYYESVTAKALEDVERSEIWRTLTSDFNKMNQQYNLRTQYNLFISSELPEFQVKSFSSALDKSFRKNVLLNKNWPNEPRGGWVTPLSWYDQLNDLIRTRIVVKYLDGVTYLCDEILDRAERAGLGCKKFMEAREEGYYAAHVYMKIPCEIPEKTWDTRRVDLNVEFQVTTQLQEVIGKLLHKYYEERRSVKPTKADKWQWEYQSDEFAANYLGHILHYVEGMIMDVRDRKQE